MQNILKDLYFGRIIPWERRYQKDAHRTEINTEIDEEKDYFMSKMSVDDWKRFTSLENLYCEAAFSEEGEIFAYAFRLRAFHPF